ncbi:hypothetical protein C7N43_04850 [Sphingobacteriales bacterium UPWRP_1]|nr:hypothetical protein BVG80_06775 [Sphingobacteriales bacterium TSM_CSM]PSJ78151.1 hypothetical protein C7N43_04850 [Sphingobacteriales bacterium UPWRP_1]
MKLKPISVYLLLLLSGVVAQQFATAQSRSNSALGIDLSDYEPGRNNRLLDTGDTIRDIIVYVPKSYNPKTPGALVLVFHNTGSDGEQFFHSSGWAEMAEAQNFIAVFPTALAYCYAFEGKNITRTRWNDYTLQNQLCAGQPANDVAFAGTLLQDLQQGLNIDPKRIYAAGFAGGADFVGRLSVELNKEIAAFGMVGGGLAIAGNAKPAPGIYPSVCYLLGQADSRISGTEQPLPIDERRFIKTPVWQTIAKLPALYHLKNNYKVIDRSKHLTLLFTDNIGKQNNEMQLTIVRNLQQSYPNGSNHPENANALLWKFFNAHSKPQ